MLQLGLGICVWKKWGTSPLVICSLGICLSICPSRRLFTDFTSSLLLGVLIIYTLSGNGEGQGYTILPVRIRCFCVEKKMGYVSVGHLLPWIFLKHMAFKNIVYSLCQFLIFGSTNDGTSLEWKALLKCWNLRVCVDKMGYVSVGHLLPWNSPKYVPLKNIVNSLL
jgi:hypothetical protein